ncbi:NADPH:quinone reductase-like Zn-dependent oxidoreductase [Paraburkholderia bannensis]|uniref:NADPH:quinone reductase-like Zn-dependent oxidoreductase n=1 Tax=Paraburkholderia bannensis TaxID=765414 RepID=A0A7W9TX74_9BURK|nr:MULTISPECIES: zinc-binding alcohol dehydrogenase family protein [Paraburkholderia]MBB3257966.1 NADPH:quinone reductase-like Zn-dependent oxidoreductase [Paraburkholderia sp. WP4_3_2]MBB6102979.1 NADPH:quinone reductase-like Zn-dependent oxidoreductase [Paraburkholderia bannensis]
MKAIQFKTFGKPDVLELVDLPTPTPAAGHALVQVKSASVNPSDVKNVSGHFDHTTLPRVPGRDFSGVVVSGPHEWIGAEVWGTGGDIGFTRDGTHAEFIEIPVAALARKPKALSHAQAASIGVNFVVGWLGTVDYAQLSAGETIAVIGVSGGVGGAVTQIAKARGARVIGVGREAPDAESPAAKLIDAFVPMDAGTAAKVRELTGGAGADVVYDAVGGVAFELALSLVKRRGRVVEISATGKRRVEFDLIDFYHNETQLLGADSAKLGVAEAAPIMRALADAFDEGKFAPPVVAERFALEHAQDAYAAVAAGTRGRVVIDIA